MTGRGLALASLLSVAALACGTAQVVAAAPEGTAAETKASATAPSSEVPASSATTTVAESPAPAPKAPSGDAPKAVGARHVLVQYVGAERAPASVVRTREQAEALAQKVLAKARRGESFTRLATEYSDEPGAAGRGGALGKFGRGKMAPAFEEAAFRLAVGEVSNVVETPFGFHVIVRTE
jgi:hypothetical protein